MPAERPRTAAPPSPARPAPAGEWLFGPYHLVPASGRLRAGERSHELDPRALSVLECLLRHAGQVVPRAVLIAEAWPDAETVLDSTVSKVMRRLRLALGDAGGHALQTVYGEGYRLALPATWLPSLAPAVHARPQITTPGDAGPTAVPSDAEAREGPGRERAKRRPGGAWLAWLPWAVATLAMLLAAWLGWLLMRTAGAPS